MFKKVLSGTLHLAVKELKICCCCYLRYPLYFQLNEGIIVKDTIVAELGETVAILNIKRGIMSAIQFDINFPKQFDEKELMKKVYLITNKLLQMTSPP